MKPQLTAHDVAHAVRYANQRGLLHEQPYFQDIADYLNARLARRHAERHAQYRARYGAALEAIGLFSCLVGLMLAITEPELLEAGILGSVIGFVVGLIGQELRA